MVSNLVHLKQQGMSMLKFLRRMASLKAEFNSLVLANKSVVEALAQRFKFFMVLTLATLKPDLDSVQGLDSSQCCCTIP